MAHIYEQSGGGNPAATDETGEAFEAPALWINPEIQDFYAFQIQDIKLIGYKSHDKISMEVAV